MRAYANGVRKWCTQMIDEICGFVFFMLGMGTLAKGFLFSTGVWKQTSVKQTNIQMYGQIQTVISSSCTVELISSSHSEMNNDQTVSPSAHKIIRLGNLVWGKLDPWPWWPGKFNIILQYSISIRLELQKALKRHFLKHYFYVNIFLYEWCYIRYWWPSSELSKVNTLGGKFNFK